MSLAAPSFLLWAFLLAVQRPEAVAQPMVPIDGSPLQELAHELGPPLTRRLRATSIATPPPPYRVRLGWADPDRFVYRIDVLELSAGGVILTSECPACSRPALVSAMAESLAAADRLRRVAPVAATPWPRSTIKRRPSPLQWCSVGALSLSAALLGVGTAFTVIDVVPSREDAGVIRQFRPPGAVILGIGAAMAVTGATMLIVDRLRRRSSVTPRRILWTPSWSGGKVSGTLIARF